MWIGCSPKILYVYIPFSVVAVATLRSGGGSWSDGNSNVLLYRQHINVHRDNVALMVLLCVCDRDTLSNCINCPSCLSRCCSTRAIFLSLAHRRTQTYTECVLMPTGCAKRVVPHNNSHIYKIWFVFNSLCSFFFCFCFFFSMPLLFFFWFVVFTLFQNHTMVTILTTAQNINDLVSFRFEENRFLHTMCRRASNFSLLLPNDLVGNKRKNTK